MRHYYLIVDTETTKKQTVADFGAVVMTKQGQIVEQFGAMVHGHFGTLPLFSDPSADPSAFWSEQSAQRRAKNYDNMLESGLRSISSVGLINQWLAGVNARYNPALTAYNLAFRSWQMPQHSHQSWGFQFSFLPNESRKTPDRCAC